MKEVNIDIDEFKKGLVGKPYKSLIQYHIKKQNSQKIDNAIKGTISLLPNGMHNVAEIIIDFWNSRAQEKTFWERDCADVFDEVTWETAAIAEKRGLETNAEALFNVFQIVTLNFAFMASTQPNLRKFAGIKKGWFS